MGRAISPLGRVLERKERCGGATLKKPPIPAYDPVPPGAPALVGSMRATGYDLETALADIIDNSITAGASEVRIIINEEGRSSWIAIADDGAGMNAETLLRAMTFGGINPSDKRAPDD